VCRLLRLNVGLLAQPAAGVAGDAGSYWGCGANAVLAGASAAVVRAAIMGVLALLAVQLTELLVIIFGSFRCCEDLTTCGAGGCPLRY